mgnify:FL=1
MDNLVQIHKNALPTELCNHIIDLFEESNMQQEGIA